MHLDQDPVIVLRVKSQRLHMRIDLAPLFRPVSADLFRPTNKAALERARPGDVRRHEGKGGVNVPLIESRVGRA